MKSSKRFRNHLDIAYASAVETADLLELFEEIGLLPKDLVDPTIKRCQ